MSLDYRHIHYLSHTCTTDAILRVYMQTDQRQEYIYIGIITKLDL